MKEGPDISRIAALIGDPARGDMLSALMDGRALTAGELAQGAGVTKQTASFHLARLLEGRLLEREVQGRHHYYRLAGEEVAAALEALMGVAESGGGRRTRAGPKDPALRKARVCYDHLAGEVGVAVFERMTSDGWLDMETGAMVISEKGWAKLSEVQLTHASLPKSNRPRCRACLDWSMRRHHLAGAVGKLLLDRILSLRWARRLPDSRIIAFSSSGEKRLQEWLAS